MRSNLFRNLGLEDLQSVDQSILNDKESETEGMGEVAELTAKVSQSGEQLTALGNDMSSLETIAASLECFSNRSDLRAALVMGYTSTNNIARRWGLPEQYRVSMEEEGDEDLDKLLNASLEGIGDLLGDMWEALSRKVADLSKDFTSMMGALFTSSERLNKRATELKKSLHEKPDFKGGQPLKWSNRDLQVAGVVPDNKTLMDAVKYTKEIGDRLMDGQTTSNFAKIQSIIEQASKDVADIAEDGYINTIMDSTARLEEAVDMYVDHIFKEKPVISKSEDGASHREYSSRALLGNKTVKISSTHGTDAIMSTLETYFKPSVWAGRGAAWGSVYGAVVSGGDPALMKAHATIGGKAGGLLGVISSVRDVWRFATTGVPMHFVARNFHIVITRDDEIKTDRQSAFVGLSKNEALRICDVVIDMTNLIIRHQAGFMSRQRAMMQAIRETKLVTRKKGLAHYQKHFVAGAGRASVALWHQMSTFDNTYIHYLFGVSRALLSYVEESSKAA